MKLWSIWHVYTLLPALAFFAIIAIIVGRLMRNKSEKTKMLPIQIISILLLALEIAKQIYCACIGYDLYSLPFHFCSLFVYIIPLFSFYNGKHKDNIRSFTVACCMALILALLIYPEIIYDEQKILTFGTNFLSAHAVIFHNLIPLAFFLILSLNLFQPKTKKDLASISADLAIYSIIASVLANVLKTNFNNFYNCSISPIRSIQEQLISSLGWPGQAIYVVGAIIATIAFGILSYGIYRVLLSVYFAIKTRIKQRSQNI